MNCLFLQNLSFPLQNFNHVLSLLLLLYCPKFNCRDYLFIEKSSKKSSRRDYESFDFHKKVSGLAFRFIFKSMLISNFFDDLNRMYITMSVNCCMHDEINFVAHPTQISETSEWACRVKNQIYCMA